MRKIKKDEKNCITKAAKPTPIRRCDKNEQQKTPRETQS